MVSKSELEILAKKLMFEMKDSEYETLEKEFDIILKQMDLIGNIKDIDKVKLADNDIKERYRVSGDRSKLLKWKIRTASDEIFSVSAKGQQEAQLVVDEIFGSGRYRVSQFLVG